MPRSLVLTVLLVTLLCVLAGVARAAPSEAIDLNKGTMAQLMQLPGIGQKRAEDIIRYRLVHPFRRVPDLMRVKGIGPKTFAKLKPLVKVEAAELDVAQASASPAAPTLPVAN